LTSPLAPGLITPDPLSQNVEEISKALNNAAVSTADVAGSVWSLGWASKDKTSQERATLEVKNQIKKFAKSMGQTNIQNITVKPRDANSVIVLSSQQPSKALQVGSFAVDISFSSEYPWPFGKVQSRFTVWLTNGMFARAGNPYYDPKGWVIDPVTNKKTPATFQNVLRAGFGEAGIQALIGKKDVMFMSDIPNLKNKDLSGFANAGFSSTLRPIPFFKQVNDVHPQGKNTKTYTESPSLNSSLDFSAFSSIGPLRFGPYVELGWRFKERERINGKLINPSAKRSKLGVLLVDRCNFALNPDFVTKVQDRGVPRQVITASNIVLSAGAAGVGTAGSLRTLGKGIGRVGWRINPLVSLSKGIGKRYPLIGVAVAILTGASMLNDKAEEKKELYREAVKQGVEAGLYKPELAIAASMTDLAQKNPPDIGFKVGFLIDVIDEARKKGLVTTVQSQKEWKAQLKFKGDNPAATKFGRELADKVYSRKSNVPGWVNRIGGFLNRGYSH
jgi:hypothetical protein